jgi:hypothetical protein
MFDIVYLIRAYIYFFFSYKTKGPLWKAPADVFKRFIFSPSEIEKKKDPSIELTVKFESNVSEKNINDFRYECYAYTSDGCVKVVGYRLCYEYCLLIIFI